MKNLISILTVVGLAVAQIDKLPKCASKCYAEAVGASSCDLTDAYCLCTSGMKQVLSVAVPCICKSTCTSEELLQAQQASNGICEAALSSKGESYHAMTLSPNVCAAGGGSGYPPSSTEAPASTPSPNSAESTAGGYGGGATPPATSAVSSPAPSGVMPPAGGYGGGNATNASGTAAGSPPPASYTGAAVKLASWVSEAGMIGLAVWAAFAL